MVGKWPKCGERRMPAAGILEMVIVHLRQPVSCWFTDSIVWRFPAHRTVNPVLCYRAMDYENLLSYPCLSGIKPCQFSGEEHNIKLLAETIIGRLKATAAVIRANIHTLYSYGTVTITLTFYDIFERWIHHSSLQADMMMGVI